MSKFDVIYQRAQANPQKIILPEGNDERVLRAAEIILRKKYAKLVIIAAERQIASDVKRLGINLSDAEIADPKTFKDTDSYIEEYYQSRKAKGMTLKEAKESIADNSVLFAGMMIRRGLAEGFVAGAKFTTRDVAKTAIQCIGVNRKVGIMSSAFVMLFPDNAFCEEGILIFADCGIVPEPNAKQLAKIAIACGSLVRQLFDFLPRVAMLSYSTAGSGSGPMVKKVVEAVRFAKQEAPDLLIDGEMQGDSALVKEVAEKKCPKSEVAGKANILIFPDLNAGNIGYKLAQRFGRAKALGPLILGAQRPCSDLSRGCTMEEIVDIAAITSVRAAVEKGLKKC